MNDIYCTNCKYYHRKYYPKWGGSTPELCFIKPVIWRTHKAPEEFIRWESPAERNKDNNCELFEEKPAPTKLSDNVWVWVIGCFFLWALAFILGKLTGKLLM